MRARILVRAERELQRLEGAAYHEAGHIVICLLVGVKVFWATCWPGVEDGIGTDGCVRVNLHKWDDPSRRLPAWAMARNDILILLAGVVAARHHGGAARFSSYALAGRDDYRLAQEIAGRYFRPERAKHLVEVELQGETWLRLVENWRLVQAVAERLMRGGVVTGSELEELMDRAVL